jgi:hypothetical protein
MSEARIERRVGELSGAPGGQRVSAPELPETVDEPTAGQWVKVKGTCGEDGPVIAHRVRLRHSERVPAIEGSIDEVEGARQAIRVIDAGGEFRLVRAFR